MEKVCMWCRFFGVDMDGAEQCFYWGNEIDFDIEDPEHYVCDIWRNDDDVS